MEVENGPWKDRVSVQTCTTYTIRVVRFYICWRSRVLEHMFLNVADFLQMRYLVVRPLFHHI